MQIISFSPRVFETVQRFFREHPVIEIKVRRAADFASAPVFLSGGICERCGWTWSPDRVYVDSMAESLKGLGEELPRGTLPGDYLDAIAWRHAWDQESRSKYCGGRIALSTAPAAESPLGVREPALR